MEMVPLPPRQPEEQHRSARICPRRVVARQRIRAPEARAARVELAAARGFPTAHWRQERAEVTRVTAAAAVERPIQLHRVAKAELAVHMAAAAELAVHATVHTRGRAELAVHTAVTAERAAHIPRTEQTLAAWDWTSRGTGKQLRNIGAAAVDMAVAAELVFTVRLPRTEVPAAVPAAAGTAVPAATQGIQVTAAAVPAAADMAVAADITVLCTAAAVAVTAKTEMEVMT